jgi:Ca2+-transporting ATPase
MDDIKSSGATEKAMLKFITRCGADYKALRKYHLGDTYTRFQFDSSRKRMSTVLNQTDSGKKRVHIKGASEIVLETCTHYLDTNGVPQLITDQMKTQLNDTI